MNKIYCYVDETGQDNKGFLFIVSVVVIGKERDMMLKVCEGIEKESGKQKDKWGKAKRQRRLKYFELIFANKKFKGKLRYSIYKNQTDYDMATIVGIAKAIHYQEPKSYTTLIYIDGLQKTRRQKYGSELRKLGIHTKKVQGVVKDENNSLIRLADSLAGLVRDAVEAKDQELILLFNNAKKSGDVVEV